MEEPSHSICRIQFSNPLAVRESDSVCASAALCMISSQISASGNAMNVAIIGCSGAISPVFLRCDDLATSHIVSDKQSLESMLNRLRSLVKCVGNAKHYHELNLVFFPTRSIPPSSYSIRLTLSWILRCHSLCLQRLLDISRRHAETSLLR